MGVRVRLAFCGLFEFLLGVRGWFNALAVCLVTEKVFGNGYSKWLNIRYTGFSLKTGKKRGKFDDLVLNLSYHIG